MSVELFENNLKAYEAVCDMLGEKQRDAVVHPIGTGKSFIAFRYIADHPEQRVLGLSLSEYIFGVQIESICSVAPEVQLEYLAL